MLKALVERKGTISIDVRISTSIQLRLLPPAAANDAAAWDMLPRGVLGSQKNTLDESLLPIDFCVSRASLVR